MNVKVDWENSSSIELREPESRPGSWAGLRAEVDCVFVLSACSNDISPVNGMLCRDVSFEIS